MGECGVEEISPEDYISVCTVNSSQQRKGSQADIAFIDAGGGTSMKVEKLSDGTVQVTLMGDVSAGANFEAAKAKFNDSVSLNAGAGVDITVSAAVRQHVGIVGPHRGPLQHPAL